MPWLEVVPAGSTRPRREVFQAFELDDQRVQEFPATPSGKVVLRTADPGVARALKHTVAHHEFPSFIQWTEPMSSRETRD
jgi:hypothetical protein